MQTQLCESAGHWLFHHRHPPPLQLQGSRMSSCTPLPAPAPHTFCSPTDGLDLKLSLLGPGPFSTQPGLFCGSPTTVVRLVLAAASWPGGLGAPLLQSDPNPTGTQRPPLSPQSLSRPLTSLRTKANALAMAFQRSGPDLWLCLPLSTEVLSTSSEGWGAGGPGWQCPQFLRGEPSHHSQLLATSETSACTQSP